MTITHLKETFLNTDHSQQIHNKDDKIDLIEKLKDKLINFSTYNKNLDQIATKLFKIIPETLELTEVVNLVIENLSNHDILLTLNAILKRHPSFSLSPYDEIRKAILEDKEHLLNNDSLTTLLKEHRLDEDEEKVTGCFDLAYRLNHPNIYRLSQTPTSASDYSLNFLWVNLNPQDRIQNIAQNIFKEGLNLSENADCIKDPKTLLFFEENELSLEEEDLKNWKEIKKSFSYRVSKWADIHPNAQINLWYDSALVTQKAQEKTFEMMKSISESRGVYLKLRDIRQLPNISGEIENSLHPGTQVYYRVDILKVLIMDHLLSPLEESPKYCVVSDIDVEPMAPQQIFDQRTLNYLSSNGYVFNGVGLSDFENSFFISNKEHPSLKKIHYETMIESTAHRIAHLRQYPIGTPLKSDFILDAHFVFRQYSDFRKKMNEGSWGNKLIFPRKIVKCPRSQFNFGGDFSESDYQKESFRFIGKSNIPYTRHGRNPQGFSEDIIEELRKWRADPLPSVEALVIPERT